MERIINLTDPTHLVLAGTIAGVSGRLALGQDDILYSTERSVFGSPPPTDTNTGVHVAALGQAVPILSVNPSYVLINQDGKTQNDLNLQYQIVPDASNVASARIDFKDEKGLIVFSTPVPVATTGTFVWPKGQTLTPTPQKLVLKVQNSDGTQSDEFTASAGGTVPLPVLLSISPARREVGNSDTLLVVKGKNFTSASRVEIDQPAMTPVALVTTYVSTTELRSSVPAATMATLGIWSVSVASGPVNSNSLPFKVVPVGLTPAPTLTAMQPRQVTATSSGLWLVLQGQGFVKDAHQVYASVAGSPLLSIYYSPTEIHALLPADFLQQQAQVSIRVQSIDDPDLASDSLVLQVLGTVIAGSGQPATLPQISGLDPEAVPHLPPGTNDESVTLLGDGFQAGAQVFARIDDGEPQSIPTQYVSPTQLSVTLTAAQYGTRLLLPTLVIDTPAGVRQTLQLVRRVQPTIQVKRNQHAQNPDRGAVEALSYLEPSLFFNPNGDVTWPWLLRHKGSYEGQATSDGLAVNPLGFEVEVSDVSLPSFYSGGVSLTIETTPAPTAPTFKGDSIPNPLMMRYVDEATRFRSQRISVVMDAVDDGSIKGSLDASASADGTSGDYKGYFSEHDGKADDQTIQGQIGGKVKVSYSNHTNGQTIDLPPQELEICPERLRRKLFINPILLSQVTCGTTIGQTTVGPPCFDPTEIPAFVEQANEIWSQACVEIEAKPLRIINNASVDLLNPAIASANTTIVSNAGTVQTLTYYAFPSALQTAVLADNVSYPKGPNEINVYFIRDFPDKKITAVALGFDGRNLYDQIDTFVGPLAPGSQPTINALGAPFTNSVFISTKKGANGLRQANSRTLAHELVHVVLHEYDNDSQGSPSITSGSVVQPDSVLRKRFTDGEVKILRDPANAIVCHWSQCP